MTPQKKRIYIIIICVCFALTAGILFWSYSGSDPALDPAQSPVVTVAPSGSGVPTDGGSVIDYSGTGFPTPAVFPSTDKFDTAILDSAGFKKLHDYQPVDIANQLGRPDPFNHY